MGYRQAGCALDARNVHGAELILAVGFTAKPVDARDDGAKIARHRSLDIVGETFFPARQKITLRVGIQDNSTVGAQINFAEDIKTLPYDGDVLALGLRRRGENKNKEKT
jgi:hypothetical protein